MMDPIVKMAFCTFGGAIIGGLIGLLFKKAK